MGWIILFLVAALTACGGYVRNSFMPFEDEEPTVTHCQTTNYNCHTVCSPKDPFLNPWPEFDLSDTRSSIEADPEE